jgi:hypothetical protein
MSAADHKAREFPDFVMAPGYTNNAQSSRPASLLHLDAKVQRRTGNLSSSSSAIAVVGSRSGVHIP